MNKLLYGMIFILFLSCLVTESRRIELSEKVARLEQGQRVLAETYINHTHYYNGKPKGMK